MIETLNINIKFIMQLYGEDQGTTQYTCFEGAGRLKKNQTTYFSQYKITDNALKKMVLYIREHIIP